MEKKDISLRDRRILSIDRFRGGLVLCMVLFMVMERFPALGWLASIGSHGETAGVHLMGDLMLADVVAPMFIFCIGLSYLPSLRRRIARDGRRAAYLHFIARYLSIMGMGYAMRVVDFFVSRGWRDPLTTIGFVLSAVALVTAIGLLICMLIPKATKAKAGFSKAMQAVLAVLGILSLYAGCKGVYAHVFLRQLNAAHWSVLQAIGFAGLVTLLFAECSTLARGIIGGLMLITFGFVHQLPAIGPEPAMTLSQLIDSFVQGGIIGGFSWASLLTLSTVFADLYHNDLAARDAGKRGPGACTYLFGMLVAVTVGIAALLLLPVSMGSVSPGYILVTLGASTVILFIVSLFENLHLKGDVLAWWGRSPIFAYLLCYIVHDVIPILMGDTDAVAFFPALAYSLGITLLMTWVLWLLSRKKTVHF